MAIISTCRGCGCDDNHACLTEDGPCHWLTLDPPLCSACEDLALDDDRDPPIDGTGIECPAPSVPAPHQLLWTGEHDAYCVRCHGAFCR